VAVFVVDVEIFLHGSFGRGDTCNTMIAIGPESKLASSMPLVQWQQVGETHYFAPPATKALWRNCRRRPRNPIRHDYYSHVIKRVVTGEKQ
jgi:hypothetical protein